jgi:hypothetical protein
MEVSSEHYSEFFFRHWMAILRFQNQKGVGRKEFMSACHRAAAAAALIDARDWLAFCADDDRTVSMTERFFC